MYSNSLNQMNTLIFKIKSEYPTQLVTQSLKIYDFFEYLSRYAVHAHTQYGLFSVYLKL